MRNQQVAIQLPFDEDGEGFLQNIWFKRWVLLNSFRLYLMQNILLISYSRTAWPSKILMSFVSFSDSLLQHFDFIGFPSQFRTYVIQISEWSFNFATKLIACWHTRVNLKENTGDFIFGHSISFSFIFRNLTLFSGDQIRFRADNFVLSATNFTKWHTNSL